MPNRALIAKPELEDFVAGCAFFGTGGGGDPQVALGLLRREAHAGRPLRWTDLSEIPGDAWTTRISRTGTTAPPTPEMIEQQERVGLREPTVPDFQARAIEVLSRYIDHRISVIVPPELGAANTAAALAVGAATGLTVVDADYVGRAIPEIANTIPVLHGRPIWPMATVDRWGNTAILAAAASAHVAERYVRHLAVAAFGFTGVAAFPYQAQDMMHMVVPNTLTKCLRVGGAIREAASQRVPVDALATAVDARVLFTGVVRRSCGENRDGFFWGEHELVGTGRDHGRQLRIWFKNENLVSWLDARPYVTAPDLLILVLAENARPLTNPEVREGQSVAVLGVRSPAPYRTPEGIDNLGPRHFGFDQEYVPVEELTDGKAT